MIGYIPFLYPIASLQDSWYLLLIPLAFGISMVYRALRMQSLERYWPSVMIMTVQIVLGMIGLAIVLMVTIQVLIPLLPAE